MPPTLDVTSDRNSGARISPRFSTHPDNSGTTSYTYNTDGTVATKTTARAQTSYTYDTFKRVTTTRRWMYRYGWMEDLCQQVNYFYDTNPGARRRYRCWWTKRRTG